MGGHLGRAASADGVLHLLGEAPQGVLIDGPALAGAANSPDHLVATEGLGDAVAFADRQQWRLERREAVPALRALPTAPDGLTLVDRS